MHVRGPTYCRPPCKLLRCAGKRQNRGDCAPDTEAGQKRPSHADFNRMFDERQDGLARENLAMRQNLEEIQSSIRNMLQQRPS